MLHILALAAAQAAAPQATIPAAPAPAVVSQPQAVPAVAPQPAPAQRILPAGTQVSVTPVEELSSKHLKMGEHHQFTVVNDVVDNGVVVIPRGSIADGEVTMETGRAIGGKSGKFDITFQSVAANGITFPLMGVHRQEGKGNTVGALLGSIWISGHSAVMLPGQIVTAMIKEPTAYGTSAAAAVPAVTVVPAPGTAVATAPSAPVTAASAPAAAPAATPAATQASAPAKPH